MNLKHWLLLYFVIIKNVNCLGRERKCCQYAAPNNNCLNSSFCLLGNDEFHRFGVSYDSCFVSLDSKKSNDPHKCSLGENYSSKRRILEPIPFKIRPYIYSQGSNQELPALDIQLLWSYPWTNVKFQLINRRNCDPSFASSNTSCLPRCVLIHRHETLLPLSNQTFLSYDCEVGFFKIGHQLISTGNTIYEFNICFSNVKNEQICGSYSFLLPALEAINETSELLLVDTHILHRHHQIVIHGETPYERVGIFAQFEDHEIVSWMKNSTVRVVNKNLKYGVYDIKIYNELTWSLVSSFEISPSSQIHLILLISLILSLLLIFGSTLLIRHILMVRQYSIDPKYLLSKNTISGKKIFIMTSIDNKSHVKVVKQFSKYLKAHCAVSDVYFALDSQIGVSSSVDQDPWKWTQNVIETISADENGFLLFISSPTSSSSSAGMSLYKDLLNNQVFICLQYIKEMDRENKVTCIHFSYSDVSSLPKILPEHLKSNSFSLPKEMNRFLSFLLKIDKISICPLIPSISPLIGPAMLDHYEGGVTLLELLANVSRTEDVLDYSKNKKSKGRIDDEESYSLLIPTKSLKDEHVVENEEKENNKALSIDLEPQVLSLKDKDYLNNRSCDTNPEFN